MLSYQNNLKTLKGKKLNVLRLLIFLVFAPLLPLAFLLDLIWFFIANYEGCLNCGYKEIITKGIFVRIIVKTIK